MPVEIFFYHLTGRPLEQALPEMLDKCYERGWPVVVRATSEARVAQLDDWLWTWRDDTFLPHGSARDGRPDRQPIWLTTTEERPNAPHTLFLIDGADWSEPELSTLSRVAVLFDGQDPDAVQAARAQWRRAEAAGAAATYWAQTPQGWAKRAGRG